MSASSHSRYRTFGCTISDISPHQFLVNSQHTKQLQVLTGREVDILFSCQTFETLNVHAERYWQRIKQRQANHFNGLFGNLVQFFFKYASRYGGIRVPKKEMDSILSQLNKFVETGYLISETELKQEVITRVNQQKPFPESSDPVIDILGIPTSGRPKSLEQCLDSFLKNFQQHGRNTDILIMDDSRNKEHQAENQIILKKIKKGYRGNIFYMNRAQRRKYAISVAKNAGLSAKVMEFGLMGHPGCNRSEGGCRNTFLLLTRGRLLLQTDDDTFCQPAKPPAVQEGITLTSAGSSDDYWFFQSFEEAVSQVNICDIDFLSLHEQMLGRKPVDIISTYLKDQKELDIRSLSSVFLTNFDSDNARIRMTVPGPAGDTCLSNDLYRLRLDGPSLDRLLFPAEEYPWHLSTRQVIRTVTEPVITSSCRCIGMNFAVDNRNILPPFMPVQARCDGIFGDLLAVCFPDAFSGNIPWVIPHEPPEVRQRNVNDIFELLERIRVNDIISALIFSQQQKLNDENNRSEDNHRILGKQLKEIAELPADTRNEEISRLYHSLISKQIVIAEQILSHHGGRPKYWVDDMGRYIEVLKNKMSQTNFLQPADIDNPDAAGHDFCHILSLFGELLMHWPDIYESVEIRSLEEMPEYVTHIT